MSLLSHKMNEWENSAVQLVKLQGGDDVRIFVKREDLTHPFVGGNKWRKLKYNLETFNQSGKSQILSFGGAWSNHIAALAELGALKEIPTIGVIRGEEPTRYSATLTRAKSKGMHLHFVSRSHYREKESDGFLEHLSVKYPDALVIPEGGSNLDGAKGCMEILSHEDEQFDVIACACGTGTTLAGVAASLSKGQEAWGFPIFKEGDYLAPAISKTIDELGGTEGEWKLITDYHFGGYSKVTDELIGFMRDFYDRNQMALDPVYTAKLFFGVWSIAKQSEALRGKSILLIHTGGMQGLAGIEQRLGYSIYNGYTHEGLEN